MALPVDDDEGVAEKDDLLSQPLLDGSSTRTEEEKVEPAPAAEEQNEDDEEEGMVADEEGGGDGKGGAPMPLVMLTVMQKRWLQHFRGRYRLFAYLLILLGSGAMFMLSLLWTQCFFPSIFNSRLEQELILNVQDQWSNHPSYQAFLSEPMEKASRMLSVYLFNVTNPSAVLLGGYKPLLTEVGPFAYVRSTMRYDVQFSDDDSRLLSYKSYDYYEPVTDPADCKEMFFRMGHSYYSATKVDCPGDSCHCLSDTDSKVTVVNPRFFRLLSQETPSGLLARLSQPYFETLNHMFAKGFVNSVRLHYVASLLPIVFRYRQWQHARVALQEALAYVSNDRGGHSAAVTLFTEDHTASPITCPSYLQAGGQSYCTWGTGAYISKGFSSQASGYTPLSEAEAEKLLDGSTVGSLLHPASLDLWIGAARHLGVIAQAPLSTTRDYQGYQSLLSVFCAWGGYSATSTVCMGKVKGLTYYLQAWASTPLALNGTSYEWARGSSEVACDTDGSTCHWGLSQGGGGQAEGQWVFQEAGPLLANSSVRALLDADVAGLVGSGSNRLTVTEPPTSLHNWALAAPYCARVAREKAGNCSGLATSRTAATVTMPAALQRHGTSNGNLTVVACGISLYLVKGWGGGNNTYMDRALAAYLNTLGLGYHFNESRMEDVGYMQWGSGRVTYALRTVRSTYNLKLPGIWSFMPKCYRQGPLEFSAFAAKAGYPHMTLGVNESRSLLQALANNTEEGQALRRRLIASVTTYRGDGTTSVRGLKDPSQRAFTTHAVYPDYVGDVDGQTPDISTHTTTKDYSLAMMLNTTYLSAGPYCSVTLQQWFQECKDRIALGDTLVTHCSMYETIATSPSFGIVCSNGLINDELGDHAHPWPRSVGHTIFALLRDYTWACVVEDENLACRDGAGHPDSSAAPAKGCDYANGGLFVSGSVRDVLFNGYDDPLSDRLTNLMHLSKRGLHLSCLEPQTSSYSEDCDELPSLHCATASKGYVVSHETLGVVLNVSRPEEGSSGKDWGLWFEHQWQLPHGLGTIDSPVTAVWRGELVNNHSFQQRQDCDPRYLGGASGLYTSCTTVMHSGQDSNDDIQRLVAYMGNTSLGPAQSSTRAQVHRGSEGKDQLTSPSLYDGFRNFTYPYKGEYYGLKSQGPPSAVLVHGQEGLVLDLVREKEDEQNKVYLQYPTRYKYDYNASKVWYIPLNRYSEDRNTWTSLQSSLSEAKVELKDHLGMPYSVPVGFFPTYELSGLPSFVGSPHCLANWLYSGSEEWRDVTGYDPSENKHHTHLDVDPVSGRAMRTAKRMQLSVRMERSSFLYDVVSSQRRCPVPTAIYSPNGYGCMAYVPMLWYDDQQVFTTTQAKHFVHTFQVIPDTVYQVGSVGLGLGCFCYLVAGLILFREWRKHREFKKKVFIDF